MIEAPLAATEMLEPAAPSPAATPSIASAAASGEEPSASLTIAAWYDRFMQTIIHEVIPRVLWSMIADYLVEPATMGATCPFENPSRETVDRFIAWCTAGGAKFDALSLKLSNLSGHTGATKYCGVQASTIVPSQTMILEVPLKLIITTDVAKEAGIGKRMVDSGVQLRTTHSYLAAFLLEQQSLKEKSQWAPYLAMLPKSFDTIPTTFSKELLAELRGSFTLEKIADRQEDVLLEWENLVQYVPEFNTRWSHAQFMWYACTCMCGGEAGLRG